MMPFFVIPFPMINPVAVEFGPISIKWYGLAYVTGLLLGWWYILQLIKPDRLWGAVPRPTAKHIDDLLIYVALGVVLGGRLGYVLFYDLDKYLADPLDIVQVWHGGMAFHGGLAGAMLGQYLFARKHQLNVLTLFDLVAGAVPIGLFFGRIANFINGELWGRVTDVSWAMVFPSGGPEPRHPSQLYEATCEGIILAFILGIVIQRGGLKRPGLVTGIFGIGYGLARIGVEFVRQPDVQVGYLAFDVITMGMVLSLPMLIIGAGFIAYALRNKAA